MTDISILSSPPFPPPVRRLIFAFSKSLAVNPFLTRISLAKATSLVFTAFLSWSLSPSFPRIRAWASLAFFCSDAASSLEGASSASLCFFPLVTCAGAVVETARRQSDARMDGMMSLHRRFITRQANAVHDYKQFRSSSPEREGPPGPSPQNQTYGKRWAGPRSGRHAHAPLHPKYGSTVVGNRSRLAARLRHPTFQRTFGRAEFAVRTHI